jgi:6,7-dimethyl-8-ribityllumazine synthase
MDKAAKLVRQTKLRMYGANDTITLTNENDRLIGTMIRGKAESFDESISDNMIKGVISVKLINKLNVYTRILAQTVETMELHGVELVVEVQNEHA